METVNRADELRAKAKVCQAQIEALLSDMRRGNRRDTQVEALTDLLGEYVAYLLTIGQFTIADQALVFDRLKLVIELRREHKPIPPFPGFSEL